MAEFTRFSVESAKPFAELCADEERIKRKIISLFTMSKVVESDFSGLSLLAIILISLLSIDNRPI